MSVCKSLVKSVRTKQYDPNILSFERAAKDHGRTRYLPEIAVISLALVEAKVANIEVLVKF